MQKSNPSVLSVLPVKTPQCEAFLLAVGKKTTDPVHHRLLAACKNPGVELESELGLIISEILDEA